MPAAPTGWRPPSAQREGGGGASAGRAGDASRRLAWANCRHPHRTCIGLGAERQRLPVGRNAAHDAVGVLAACGDIGASGAQRSQPSLLAPQCALLPAPSQAPARAGNPGTCPGSQHPARARARRGVGRGGVVVSARAAHPREPQADERPAGPPTPARLNARAGADLQIRRVLERDLDGPEFRHGSPPGLGAARILGCDARTGPGS